MSNERNPFRIQDPTQAVNNVFGTVGALSAALLESLSGLRRLEQLYYDDNRGLLGVDGFLEFVLDTFKIRVDVARTDVERIPVQGPLIVVANHPFGGLEGLIAAQLLRRRRDDVKVLANHLLQRLPDLEQLFIGVDPYGGRKARRHNIAPVRDAIRWVRRGGVLVVFPAGDVSQLRFSGLTHVGIVDPPWDERVARLIRLTQADTIPVFFAGRNSVLFQLAGLAHKNLKTLLLPRELLNKKNTEVELRIGKSISASKIADIPTDRELVEQLRTRTYLLGAKMASEKGTETKVLRRSHSDGVALADPVDKGLLKLEVANLPASSLIETAGFMRVYAVASDQIPWLLREIGRLREAAFRTVGEGTGQSSDVDIFDSYYVHIFSWNTERDEVVGAYRLGLSDDILRRYGLKGLYTHTLFRYDARFLQRIAPAIELGRSFVRQEYQRSFSALLLLWKGIALFVAARPRYRYLFGPVSISSDYAQISQALLVQYLRTHRYADNLARLVKPRLPFRATLGPREHVDLIRRVDDLDQLSDLVSGLEADAKGVPALLRQYLKMGGVLLGFNVDASFNNSLDGLILVDLVNSGEKLLSRYMGPDVAGRYLAYHQDEMRQTGS